MMMLKRCACKMPHRIKHFRHKLDRNREYIYLYGLLAIDDDDDRNVRLVYLTTRLL